MPEELEVDHTERLRALIASAEGKALDSYLESVPVGEVPRSIELLEEEERRRLVESLPIGTAARLIDQLPEAQAVEMLRLLDAALVARLLAELPSAEKADLLGDLGKKQAQAVISAMEPEEAAEARALGKYPDDVAGGLMITEFLTFPESSTVGDVVQELRRKAEQYATYDVQYIYVTSPDHRLVGVLRFRELLLDLESRPLRELMLKDPVTAPAMATRDELRALFDRYPYFGVPVVDDSQAIVGVVRRVDVEEAMAEAAEGDFLRSRGIVGGEELRSMPVPVRSRRRLAWLSINIVLNLIAASIIAAFQETLAAVIALAVFLPMLSDMSGASGNQAVAVSMRELAMGLIQPRDAYRVWVREIAVGAINGIVLGALVGCLAWFWKGNPYLGLVVGGALCINVMVAVSAGGTIPLLLKRLHADPAVASGPILTTITDMCGFFMALSFAAALMPLLKSS